MTLFAVCDVSTVGCVALSATSFFLSEQDRRTTESIRRINRLMDNLYIFPTGLFMAITWIALFFLFEECPKQEYGLGHQGSSTALHIEDKTEGYFQSK